MTETVQLNPGDAAPDFTAIDEQGNEHSLKTYLDAGKTVILYFYPKDSTPGCTCLLYTSPSPRDGLLSRMPSSA